MIMTYENETAFDTATRVAAGDDGITYDNASIALHWATALLVVVQFALAETWDFFAKPTQHSMESLHMSFGVVLAAVIAARLLWRLMPGHEVSSLERGWVKTASRSVHYLLYALLIAVVVLGFLLGWSGGRPVDFFGIGIPGPLAALPRPQRHLIRELHNYVAWAIVILAFGHALAALWHHYLVKDRVLVRMLPRGSKRR
jgi:cytochrome b561